jgi:aminoglycoside phosphotransferase (APT) family kinase protein
LFENRFILRKIYSILFSYFCFQLQITALILKKIEPIIRHFLPIGATNYTINPLGNGLVNDTYLVENQSITFVLQRVNTHVFPNPNLILENTKLVAAHLDSVDFGLKIPMPVAANDGRFLITDADKNVWRAFPFFGNTFSPETDISPDIAHESARAIGHFLKKTHGFSVKHFQSPLPGFHDTAKRFDYFLKIFDENKYHRNSDAKAEIDAIFSKKHYFLTINALISAGKLPIHLTHGDPKAGNILLHKTTQKAVAVIDLDTMMGGSVLADFGDMMRSFAPNLAENDPEIEKMTIRKSIVKAMINGFLSEMAEILTPTERENLFLGGQWIIYEQALRFLTDFLAGDIYYKTTNPLQNLHRTRNQLALLAALEKSEKLIKNWISPF